MVAQCFSVVLFEGMGGAGRGVAGDRVERSQRGFGWKGGGREVRNRPIKRNLKHDHEGALARFGSQKGISAYIGDKRISYIEGPKGGIDLVFRCDARVG